MFTMIKPLLSVLVILRAASAFAPIQSSRRRVVSLFEQSVTATLDLSLPKPLGLILEEVEEGQAAGVFVKEVAETGSAVDFTSQILGAKLSTVQGTDVTAVDFDAAMDVIINAPDTVDLSFLVQEGEDSTTVSDYAVGDPVSVVVKQDGQADLVLDAKVGDNLRKTLLDGGFEVYQGLKQKLGNCGGGGQCTFCAVDFIDFDGWEERSDYEDQKLSKFPNARLSCLNNIQGPVTVQKTQR